MGNDTNYNKIFSIYSYPSATDPSTHASSKQFGENFGSFYEECSAICAKKVHQPRLQAIQEMDRVGISELLWKRMSGHKQDAKVHTRSYAHNPPSKCLIQRAGSQNPDDLKGFNPVHFLPSPLEQSLLDRIVYQLIPGIVDQRRLVIEEYKSTLSPAKRRENRLTTIKGLLTSAVKDVEHFVIMAACPIVDPKTHLLDRQDTRSLWEIHHNSIGLAALLNLQAFYLPEFKQLQESVLNKMLAAQDFASTLSEESKCAMEQYVKEHVARPILLQQQEN